MKQFVVIGLDNFGCSVAEALYSQGHEVIALDSRKEAVDRIAGQITRAAVADVTSLEALHQAGANQADAGVVSTGDDINASILATMALKDLGVRDVYVKVISSDHAQVMDRLGVTETVFPERDCALSLARRLGNTQVQG